MTDLLQVRDLKVAFATRAGAAEEERRHAELFVVSSPRPVVGIVVGKEDVVHVHHGARRERRQNPVEEQVDVASRHQGVAGIDHQDVTPFDVRENIVSGLLNR